MMMNSSVNKRGNRQTMSNTVNMNSSNHSVSNTNTRNYRSKNGPSEKSVTNAEGVYSNARLMHATTSLMGTCVRLATKDGKVYEGVLNCFSPDFELAVDMVTIIDPKTVVGGQNLNGLLASLKARNEVNNTMIFKFPDIVTLSILNVDLDYAAKGHFTDTEISRFDSSSLNKNKDLVPWECPQEENLQELGGLSIDDQASPEKVNQNGWTADDMFKLNKDKYNVKSTYDDNLHQYTVPLNPQDTEEYRQLEAEAERIAQEVEADGASRDRVSKEVNDDEEEKYSAVIRAIPEPPSISQHNRQPPRRKPAGPMTGQNIGPRGKNLQNNGPPSAPMTVHSKYQSHSYSELPREPPKPQHMQISPSSSASGYKTGQQGKSSSLDAKQSNSYSNSKDSDDKPDKNEPRNLHESSRRQHQHQQAQQQQQHHQQQQQQQQQIQQQQQEKASQHEKRHQQEVKGSQSTQSLQSPQNQAHPHPAISKQQSSQQSSPQQFNTNQQEHAIQHQSPHGVPQDKDKPQQNLSQTNQSTQGQQQSGPEENAPAQGLPQRTQIGQRTNLLRKKEDIQELKRFGNEFRIYDNKKSSSRESKEPVQSSKSDNNLEVKESRGGDQDATTSSSTPNSKLTPSVSTPSTKPSPPVEPIPTETENEAEKLVKKSTLNPNAKEFNPGMKSFTPRSAYSSGQSTPTTTPSGAMVPMANYLNNAIVHNHNHPHNHSQQPHHQSNHHQPRMQSPMVAFPPSTHFISTLPVIPNQFIMSAPNISGAPPFQPANNTHTSRSYRKSNPQQYQNPNNRHDYSQTSATVAAATGHPVLAASPMQGPYPGAQQQPGVVTSAGTPQQMYQSVYMPHPRMNIISPQSGVVMPHVQPYDHNLQPIYMAPVSLQPHMLTQVQPQQNVSGAGQMSTGSTPQSLTPNTSMQQGAPTPSPVHHQGRVPNPTPTPPQAVIYLSPQGGQPPVSLSAHSANSQAHYVNQMVPLIIQPNQNLAHSHQMAQSGHVHSSIRN